MSVVFTYLDPLNYPILQSCKLQLSLNKYFWQLEASGTDGFVYQSDVIINQQRSCSS